ncbi:MAG: hypothetical protein D6772_16430 [Bacteroidetes bacterium]|nr:MAG: hypothetical protein D6772_16430 [Bacteroidota bacterium]
MQYLGLLFEILLLALGVYLYLFARGLVKVKDPERAARAEAFRTDNATWMRLLGLALAAIMLLNLLVRLGG